jgi:hypothetical protein
MESEGGSWVACEITRIEGAALYARISGEMKAADQQALQKAGLGLISRHGKVRLHVTLEGFRGWEKGVDWSDIDFLMTHGRDVAKIAVVGEERWKEQILAFLGKGLRPTEIEFFTPASAGEADRWIQL